MDRPRAVPYPSPEQRDSSTRKHLGFHCASSGGIEGNSFRRFLLQRQTLPDGSVRGLVVDATARFAIEKHSLLGIEPQFGFNSDTRTPQLFARFLAGRYTRPAVKEELVTAIHRPVVRAIKKLKDDSEVSRILSHVGEVRYVVSDEGPPPEIEVLFMREERDTLIHDLTDEEQMTLSGWLEQVFKKDGGVRVLHADFYSSTDISLHDYESSTVLPLYQYSMEGTAAGRSPDIPHPDDPASPAVQDHGLFRLPRMAAVGNRNRLSTIMHILKRQK
jgi:hypothetical protein